MHIDTLTRWVLDSGLSTLGLRGRTPRQTLNPVITKHPEMFRRTARGYCELRDPEPSHQPVRIIEAHRRYIEWKSQRDKARTAAQEMDRLRRENSRLRRRNKELRVALNRISDLCTDVQFLGAPAAAALGNQLVIVRNARFSYDQRKWILKPLPLT